jgi:hypothetical protein
MIAGTLLVTLRARGVRVALATDEGQLRVSAPAGVLTDTDRVALRGHKDALRHLLEHVASMQADGTALVLRGVYGDLDDAERARLHAEAEAGEPLAMLVVGAL